MTMSMPQQPGDLVDKRQDEKQEYTFYRDTRCAAWALHHENMVIIAQADLCMHDDFM
jgi:hypothetical protein